MNQINMDDDFIPTVNRKETVLACAITFLCLAWMGVLLRLYVRFHPPRTLGWDDFFVAFAAISTTAGSIVTCLMPDAGMGKHFWTLDNDHMTDYFMMIYASNVTYCSSTALIKLAILFQYLRLFDMQKPLARRLTIGMIVVTATWGAIFFFMAVFSCWPISKNWHVFEDGRCVGFGSKDGGPLFASFASHRATNMMLDILILLLPLPFLKSLRMRNKARIGIISLFVMGGIVAVFSVAGMFCLALNRAGTVPVFDPTWAAPPIYIFSVLEVNVAILCASVPIFWPLVSSLATNKILVVNEIEVRTSRRDSQAVGLSEQGSSYDDLDDGEGGRTSRMSIIVGGYKDTSLTRTPSKPPKAARSNSKKLLHKHKSSTSSSRYNAPIELGSRVSQESRRQLAHHQSNNSLSGLSGTSPDGVGRILGTTRSSSVGSTNKKHYEDRYVQDWVVPDFDKQAGTGYTTTVERAEVPYDHLKALEK